MRYYILRTYSHTDRQQLWKVMTRSLSNRQEAISEKKFLESLPNPRGHTYFIVSR